MWEGHHGAGSVVSFLLKNKPEENVYPEDRDSKVLTQTYGLPM